MLGTGRNIPGCVSVDCMDSAKWMMISDDQLWSMVDRISGAAATSTKADFARWIDCIMCKFLLVGHFFDFYSFVLAIQCVLLRLEKAIGITYDDHSLLFQDYVRTWLKPISTWTYDGMHCLFANGIVSVEIVS